MPRPATLFTTAIGLATLLAAGCGKSDPPVYPITGKVTLGGKPYERVIVYFRPVNGEINAFNLGVGETEKDGTLKMRSSGGMGVMAGEYKVTFTYQMVKTAQGARAVGADEKASEVGGGGNVTAVEMVPDTHAAGKAEETTPVRFTVKPGDDNRFEFDIPSKK
jgi:hypothetical protein